ncbi:MAG: SDR family oxidoreductase, partial [Myxococcales bacterium]|nr:SDR family oxidoreductase [Myxococcales bacterium]
DLNACAALEPTLRPRAHAVSGRDVILTGATGFVGGYLLAELLARSPRRVVCLVRARDPEHGWSRIAETARRLGRTIERARVEVVPADLSRPQLGLTDDVFAALAERAHRVIHCAARVDWSAPFEELRPTNVGGTIEVIRLACLAGGAAIHYVSSIGVVPVDRGGPRSRAGSERVADGERLRLPYFQSKSWPRAPTPFNTPQRAAS